MLNIQKKHLGIIFVLLVTRVDVARNRNTDSTMMRLRTESFPYLKVSSTVAVGSGRILQVVVAGPVLWH